MIVEWLFGLASGFVQWIATLFPDFTAPDFLTGFDDLWNQLWSTISGVGPWADWGYIITVVGVVLVTWAACFGIKVVRALLAHVPEVGGSG